MSKTLKWNRRRVLQALAGGGGALAFPACDQLDVKIRNNPDAVMFDENGKPYIPPVTSNDDFYRYQCCGSPNFKPENWVLTILDRGEVIGTIEKSYLDTLPIREIELTLECIGSGPRNQNISNAVWGGWPLKDVLEDLGIALPGATIEEFRIVGVDDYHASLPVEKLDEEGGGIWLIWEMNHDRLPDEHGYPARLMVPGRYGVKNIKWVKEFEYYDGIWEGYWDRFDWDHEAVYRVNGYILVPSDQSVVDAGPVHVLGTAFAGEDPVVRVEITTDGDNWTDCVFDYAPGANRWVLWSHYFEPKAGEYPVQIRCTTESGAKTQGTQASSAKAGYDGGQRIKLTVI